MITNENGVYEKTGLPAGRYTIAFHKKGYKDRIGKTKIVAPGIKAFDRTKMRKEKNIFFFYLKHFFTWQLFVGFIVGFIVAFILMSLRLRSELR